MDPDAQSPIGRQSAESDATEPRLDEDADRTFEGPELRSTPDDGLGARSNEPEVVGTSPQDDPWREIMMDLARLIIEVHRDDPHRFDRD